MQINRRDNYTQYALDRVDFVMGEVKLQDCDFLKIDPVTKSLRIGGARVYGIETITTEVTLGLYGEVIVFRFYSRYNVLLASYNAPMTTSNGSEWILVVTNQDKSSLSSISISPAHHFGKM